METNGTCKRLQTVSREVTNEWKFLQAVENSFVQAKHKFEATREDPTPDAHQALWVGLHEGTRQNRLQPAQHIQER